MHSTDRTVRPLADRIKRVEENLILPRLLESQDFPRAPLASRMVAHDTPGVSIAVIDRGRIEWARGYGVREVGHHDPVTTATLFQACSISKPVCAMAALRLADQGHLDLDEDINHYLRSWKVPANGAWQPRVTIRQIVSHSAGLTMHGFYGYHRSRPWPTTVQVLDGQPPANSEPIRVDIIPGFHFRYSGGGFVVLQQLLMDVTGMPFTDLMRDLVLEPLGMHHSTFAQPLPPEQWAMAASGHLIGGAMLDGQWHVYPEQGAGGLWTTATDLARFASSLGRALVGEPHPVLSRHMIVAMLTPQPGSGAGLGLALHGAGPDLRCSHTGSNRGYKCMLIAYPERGQGAVVMTNAEQGWDLGEELLLSIAAEYGWPRRPDYKWQSTLPPARLSVEMDPAVLSRYSGTYQLEDARTVAVSVEEGRLWLRPPEQPALPLDALAEAEYAANATNTIVAFTTDSTGAAMALHLTQNDKQLEAIKVS